jgi:hypothetical protein
MADGAKQFGDYHWADVGEGFLWELTDAAGDHVAEVTFQEESGQRWSWYVPLDEAWHYANGPNPSGLARSADAAKAICEAILKGTYLRE